jgi:acetylornithine deacetylase
MKPTQIACTPGGINQLPPECTVQGDIRLTPFYHYRDIMDKVEEYVRDINANPNLVIEKGIGEMNVHGPHSKYTLPEESLDGKLTLIWSGDGENGVACKLDSPGFKAICEATEKVLGSVKPYSIGGSLPLIRDLQDKGFDVQIAGYGISSRYVSCACPCQYVQ